MGHFLHALFVAYKGFFFKNQRFPLENAFLGNFYYGYFLATYILWIY